ncbi:hypothetical protein DFH09DRAFT_1098195 [Mycena vulgaris]|nr:hypothetical protein DFH09DRAFT_1098195 [Mycena vulgaris]
MQIHFTPPDVAEDFFTPAATATPECAQDIVDNRPGLLHTVKLTSCPVEPCETTSINWTAIWYNVVLLLCLSVVGLWSLIYLGRAVDIGALACDYKRLLLMDNRNYVRLGLMSIFCTVSVYSGLTFPVTCICMDCPPHTGAAALSWHIIWTFTRSAYYAISMQLRLMYCRVTLPRILDFQSVRGSYLCGLSAVILLTYICTTAQSMCSNWKLHPDIIVPSGVRTGGGARQTVTGRVLSPYIVNHNNIAAWELMDYSFEFQCKEVDAPGVLARHKNCIAVNIPLSNISRILTKLEIVKLSKLHEI